MMQTKEKPPFSAWLGFAVFLGLSGALFTHAYLAQIDPNTPITRLLWLSAALGVAGAPLVGAVCDFRRAKPTAAALFGLIIILLLAWDRSTLPSVPLTWSAPLIIIFFIFSYTLYKSLTVHFEIAGPFNAAGKGTAVGLGTFALVLWAASVPALLGWLYGLGTILALVCLALFFRDSGSLRRPEGDSEPNAKVFFLYFFRGAGGDHYALFAFTFFWALAVYWFFSDTIRSLRLSYAVSSPLIWTLAALVLGSCLGLRLNRDCGVKRNLTLSALLLASITWLKTLVGYQGQLVVIVVGALLVGLSHADQQTLYAQFSRRRHAGLLFGFYAVCLFLGIAAGVIFEDPASYGRQIFAWVGAIIFLQIVSFSHAPRPASEEETDTGPIDEWPEIHTESQNPHDLLSRTLQRTAQVIAEIFFGKVRIEGREHLEAMKQGAVLMANHPNTFLDPLLITAIAPGRLHYLAKATLWRVPIIGSILDRMGAIPVFRAQDYQAGDRPDNRESLSAAAAKLAEGRLILIFPEGVSKTGLSLKPLKTGAARLGFQALENQEKLDIPLIPIGIDYLEPPVFRSPVTLRIGAPLYLAQYLEAYQQEPRTTVRSVTEEVSERLKNLIPHLDTPQLEELVQLIHRLYGERVQQILGVEDETAARKTISNAVRHYQKLDPDTVLLFHERIKTYFRELDLLGTPENHEPISFRFLFKLLREWFSFTSFGLLANWLPYRLVGKAVERMDSDSTWIATAKLGFGTLIFGLYYALIIFVLRLFIGLPAAILVVALIIDSGLLALGSLDRVAFRFRQIKTLWQAFWTQDTNDDLEDMKLSLIQDLEGFRETYAFYLGKEKNHAESIDIQ